MVRARDTGVPASILGVFVFSPGAVPENERRAHHAVGPSSNPGHLIESPGHIIIFILEEEREAAPGGKGAQRHVLRVNEPKTRSSRARGAAKTHDSHLIYLLTRLYFCTIGT